MYCLLFSVLKYVHAAIHHPMFSCVFALDDVQSWGKSQESGFGSALSLKARQTLRQSLSLAHRTCLLCVAIVLMPFIYWPKS